MSHFTPLQSRTFSIDVLRGVAILGILFLNIFVFGFGFSYSGNPIDMGHFVKQSEGGVLLFRLIDIVAEGKMRGILSVLFGVGAMMLLTREGDEKLVAVDLYYRRIVWLLIFGLINAFVLLWPGDILYSYALCGLFLFPLKNASNRLLMLLMTVMFLSLAYVLYTQYDKEATRRSAYVATSEKMVRGDSLTTDEKKAISDWNDRLKPPTKEQLDKTRMARSGSYAEIFSKNIPNAQFLESTGLYRYYFFDIMLLMIVGILLFRVHFFQPTFPLRRLLVISLLCYGISMPLIVWGESRGHLSNYASVDHEMWRLISAVMRPLVVVGHMSALLILIRVRALRWLFSGFAAAGRMAFSNYLLQSVIGIFIFTDLGMHQYASLSITELQLTALTIVTVEILLSIIWLRFFELGPFEWLWRSLIRWEFLPIKRRD